MYKKVRLMSPFPASISGRNGFMRKFSLVETIVDATICVPQRRFDPGVSWRKLFSLVRFCIVKSNNLQ